MADNLALPPNNQSLRESSTEDARPLAGMRVLVVEDDAELLRRLMRWLVTSGTEVEGVGRISHAREKIEEAKWNVLVTDRVLPDGDAAQHLALPWLPARMDHAAARSLRRILISRFPVESSTGLVLQEHGVVVLEKPVSCATLVRAVLVAAGRVAGPEYGLVLEVGPVRVDTASWRVTARGRPIDLAPLAYKVLVHLMRNRGRWISAAELRAHVWRDITLADNASVRNQIAAVRSALGPDLKGFLQHSPDGLGWGIDLQPADRHP